MDAIRPITIPPPLPAVRPVLPTPDVGQTASGALDPAVTVEIGTDAAPASSGEQMGYERDTGSHAIVFRVTDMLTGDVILQIPDEIVLKARSYAGKDAAPVGERVETRA